MSNHAEWPWIEWPREAQVVLALIDLYKWRRDRFGISISDFGPSYHLPFSTGLGEMTPTIKT
jgi:hypothetical protein